MPETAKDGKPFHNLKLYSAYYFEEPTLAKPCLDTSLPSPRHAFSLEVSLAEDLKNV